MFKDLYKNLCVCKKSIIELVNAQKLPKYKVAKECGIDRLTLRLAGTIGNQVSMQTAKCVANYFNVPLDKYFSIEQRETKYSCATNKGIKNNACNDFKCG